MPKRETGQLSVITKKAAAGRSVISAPNPAIKGTGDGDGLIDFVCGGCRAIILDAVQADSVQNVVFVCADCGAYNATLM